MSDQPFPAHLAWLTAPSSGPDVSAAAEPDDITGVYAWRAGVRLSAELGELVACRDRRVADIGCGRGHLGFSALALGAREVVFNDASAVMTGFVARIIAANRLEARARVDARGWGEAVPGGPCGVILGGDVLYRPACFAALLTTIARSLDADGICLLSDPRTTLEAELPDLADTLGLTWSSSRRHDYTLVRVTRR